ncbi:MAG TPA: class I SAM-dependent methyltransferase [Actinomycetota bacterium]|jgi:ubiquinone/menaquinone biosynthesis C-methylase UbiE
MHGRGILHGATQAPFRGRASRVYDRVAGLLLRRFHRRVAADVAAATPAGAAVLDAGAGTGRLLLALARGRPDLRLSGVDLEADMVALAERNVRAAGLGGRVALQVGDVADLPYDDEAFDLVVSTLSMHHWADVEAAAGELARVLRPGGRLWIYDFRSAPGGRLAEAVAAVPAFAGRPLEREPFRHGLLHLYVRFAIAKARDAA